MVLKIGLLKGVFHDEGLGPRKVLQDLGQKKSPKAGAFGVGLTNEEYMWATPHHERDRIPEQSPSNIRMNVVNGSLKYL